jgi:ABC-type hemin transport system ATPase subunit
MSLISVQFKDFRRFKLNEVSEFSLEVDSPIVTVLGKNGSGKTSLLKLLLGKAPSHREFLKTGSFEARHQYKGKEYLIKAVFNPSAKYYFEVDGKVLNDWGTISVQNQLTTQHFGVDNEVFNLLVGEDRFHQMSGPKRKDWLIRLCHTNYDYAIAKYTQFKEKHRDVSGALKIAKQRLSSELQKKLQDKEVAELEMQCQLLHELVQELSEGRIPLSPTPLVHSKEGLLELIRRFSVMGGYKERWPAFQLKATADKAKVQQQLCQNTIARVGREMQSLSASIEILQKAEKKTIDSIQLEIVGLKATLVKLEASLKIPELLSDATRLQITWLAVRSEVQEILDMIPDNAEGRYSSKSLETTRQSIASIKISELTANRRAADLGAKLNHLEQHRHQKGAECPACHHVFSLVYNEDQYQLYSKSLKSLQEELQKIAQALKSLQVEEEVCSEYGAAYRRYVALTNRNRELGAYWDYLQDQKTLSSNPKLQRGLKEVDQELAAQVAIQTIKLEIKEKELLLASLRQVGQGADLAKMLQLHRSLETELNGLIDRISRLKSTEHYFTQQHRQRVQVDEMVERIKRYMESMAEESTASHEQLRRSHYNDALRSIQSLLASKTNQLHQDQLQARSVQVYQRQIEELTKEEQAYALLVKALSPTEGLIAEGLFGFIDSLIQNINEIVEQVWSYPMTIQLAKPEGDSVDLDYKFPVHLDNEDQQTTSDVSELSKGQKEMFDLAFLVTAMVYLEMTEMPLLLDEIGSSFDPEHRTTLIGLMKSLIESRSFSQIFLVSHYQQQYMSLSSQVVELTSAVS